MTNLENIENFLLEDDIDIINQFIGKPTAIEMDKKSRDVSDETREFLYRLSKAIKIKAYKNCQRNCVFRKIKENN